MDLYDNRVCRPLTLYEEEDYRVYRTSMAEVLVERRRIFKWDDEEIIWWQTLKVFRFGYTTGTHKEKLAKNKVWAERGKAWIARWKLLLFSPMWEVRCNDWDGQGTPCPIQRQAESGEMGCPIRFFYLGYSGDARSLKPLPGRCDGPLNFPYTVNVCVPGKEDEYGFSMMHLAGVRHEIMHREE